MELLRRIVNNGFIFDTPNGITYNLELQGYLKRLNNQSLCLYPTEKAISLMEVYNV